MGVFGNSGQVCVAGTRLFVQRRIQEEFVDRLKAFSKTLKICRLAGPVAIASPYSYASIFFTAVRVSCRAWDMCTNGTTSINVNRGIAIATSHTYVRGAQLEYLNNA